MAAVYRGMDQQTLDSAYDARATVADFEAEMARYRRLSDDSYARCRVIRDLAYGPSPAERIDLFPAGEGAPLFIFVHGGYWRLLGRAESAFMARNMVAHGVAVAVVEYGLAPAVALDEIVAQVRRAVASLYRNAPGLGIDPGRLFIGGSSAGAHLAAMALATDWPGAFGLPEGILRGALLASGLYDLEPVRLSRPNTWLNLDADAARRNSPVHHPPRTPVPCHLVWGGSETGEFKRQSRAFAELLAGRGHVVSQAEIADRNHFDIVTDLADPARALFEDTMALMGMKKGPAETAGPR